MIMFTSPPKLPDNNDGDRWVIAIGVVYLAAMACGIGYTAYMIFLTYKP